MSVRPRVAEAVTKKKKTTCLVVGVSVWSTKKEEENQSCEENFLFVGGAERRELIPKTVVHAGLQNSQKIFDKKKAKKLKEKEVRSRKSRINGPAFEI